MEPTGAAERVQPKGDDSRYHSAHDHSASLSLRPTGGDTWIHRLVERIAELSQHVHSVAPTRTARRALLVALLAVLATPGVVCAQRSAPPDVIFTATFITLDSTLPRVEAIAVRRGIITALGSRVRIDSMAGPETQRLRMPGVVVPGFADAHVHPLALGALLETLDLYTLPKDETLRRVRQAARSTPAGQWIRGERWDESFWQPSEFPMAAELDSASDDHPVILTRIDGHAVWVNSRALRLARITRRTTDPPGGRIVRDASGAPTGVLVDAAVDLVRRVVPAPTPAVIERQLRAAFAQYLAWGLTSVHDAGASMAEIAVYRSLAERRAIPLRVYLMASAEEPALTQTLARGPQVGLGGGMLTLRSVKVVLDGALGSRGAELSAPYSDSPDQRGLAIVSDSALDAIIGRAVARGFQVNVHAIGDAANRRLLDGFARAGAATRALRFRAEHVSMLRDEDLPRLARMGVIASMQPVFVGEYSRFAQARVGLHRLPWVYRTRDVLTSGAVIASGTDYPASDTGDPIATLFSLVTRRGTDGMPTNGWLPQQAVSVDAALRSMTAGPAYAAFQESSLGALTVGRLADFTVLSDDPYTVAPAHLRSLRVLATVIGGRVRYRAPAASEERLRTPTRVNP